MFKNRNFFWGSVLVVMGIAIGFLATARLDILPKIDAISETKYSSPYDIEQAVIKVADEAGKAVVSVSTVHISKSSNVKRHYFSGTPFGESPFGDDMFNRFFGDFFGNVPSKQVGLGSGVIIDKEGYILTNAHVVEGADKITVALPDGREFSGEIKGTDARSDLAVIKINANNLPVAKLGDSNDLKIGQWAVAIGNPFGYMIHSPEPTVTTGVISALHRSLPRSGMGDRDYNDLIQTDAAINPGNSGGPLVNLKGEVVGINVAIFSTTGGYQGVGFAIPINVAKRIVESLIEGKKVLYGWLGVSVQEVTEDLSKYFDLSEKQGVIVSKVFKDSPAEKGGLKDGDIITSFAGQKIKSVRELVKTVGMTDVGKKVKVDILRDKKNMTLEIEVGERPEDLTITESAAKEEEQGWRGLSVANITPEIAQKFKLEKDQGVVVTYVEPGSLADYAGIFPGDIIMQIDKRDINNIDDFNKVTKPIQGDALIRTDKGYSVIKAE